MVDVKTSSKTLAAVYVRVSSDKQERWSPDAQERALREQCARMGFEPVIYRETGSGETLDGRPEILRLLKDARAGRFGACLVIEMSRLSRDRELLDWLTIKQVFRDAGVRLCTPTQSFDLRDAEDDFLTNLFGSLSAREKQLMIQRMKRGRREAKRKGAYLQEFVPFGWHIVNRQYELHPVEAEAVRMMARLALTRSGRQIARALDAAGYRPKGGGAKWNRASVNQILQNTTLYGELRFAGEVTPIPAILSRAEWDAIQVAIRGRKISPRQVMKYQYLLAGLFHCGLCGRRLSPRSDWYRYTRKDGSQVNENRYPNYVCTGRSDAGCRMPMVKGQVAEAAVWEEVKRYLKSPKLIYDALSLAYTERDSLSATKGQEESKLRAKLEGLVRQEAAMAREFYGESGTLSRDAFHQALAEIRQERAVLETRLAEVQETPVPKVQELVHLESLEGACQALAADIDAYSFEEKREVLELLVERVTMRADFSMQVACRAPLSADLAVGGFPGRQVFVIAIPPIHSVFARFRRWRKPPTPPIPPTLRGKS